MIYIITSIDEDGMLQVAPFDRNIEDTVYKVRKDQVEPLIMNCNREDYPSLRALQCRNAKIDAEEESVNDAQVSSSCTSVHQASTLGRDAETKVEPFQLQGVDEFQSRVVELLNQLIMREDEAKGRQESYLSKKSTRQRMTTDQRSISQERKLPGKTSRR